MAPGTNGERKADHDDRNDYSESSETVPIGFVSLFKLDPTRLRPGEVGFVRFLSELGFVPSRRLRAKWVRFVRAIRATSDELGSFGVRMNLASFGQPPSISLGSFGFRSRIVGRELRFRGFSFFDRGRESRSSLGSFGRSEARLWSAAARRAFGFDHRDGSELLNFKRTIVEVRAQ